MFCSFRAIGLVALTLSTLSKASPVYNAPRGPSTTQCSDFLIYVGATAHTKQIDPTVLLDNLNNTAVLIDFIKSQASPGEAGTIETTGDYMMSARFCEPSNDVKSRRKTIHYLQHAITMTKDYWNGLSYPDGYQGDMYSYIHAMSQAGYATLSVDNLGSGGSSHPNPILEVQQPMQVEIIHQIITHLRAGNIGGPVGTTKWDKVIYGGHSYGSICGNALVASYPNDVDALVLTGYTGNFINGLVPLASGGAVPATLVSPRFLGDNVGYLAQTLIKGRQYGLYTVGDVGGFDPGALVFDFAHEGTVAIGELASLFYGLQVAEEYTGSVYVITGKQDAIVCNTLTGADCGSGATSQPAQAAKYFPKAQNYSFTIPDKTGHNTNIHYSSPDSFNKAVAYLEAQGF